MLKTNKSGKLYEKIFSIDSNGKKSLSVVLYTLLLMLISIISLNNVINVLYIPHASI